MDKYENPLPGIIIGAMLSEDSISDVMNSYQTSGMYSSAIAYYNYGKNSYTRGLPTGNLRNTGVDTDSVQALIESEIEAKIELLYVLYDNSFDSHYVSMYLQDTRAMDYTSKLIGVNPPTSTGSVHYSHYTYNEVAQQLSIVYLNGDGITLITEVIPFTYQTNKAYQVLYRLLDDELLPTTADPIYWMFIEESVVPGDDPLFPDLDVSPLLNSNYMPIVPFYEDKEIFVDEAKEDTPLYITSRRLLKKLGLNYEDLGASLAEGTGDSLGEDKGLYCYFQLSAEVTAGATFAAVDDIPIDDGLISLTSGEIDALILKSKPHQATLHYLYEFFLVEQGNSKHNKNNFENSYLYGLYKTAPRKNSLLITDETYQLTLSYYYIDFNVKTGVITDGTIGAFTSEVREGNIEVETMRAATTDANTSRLLIRKQISSTQYAEVEVCGLVQEFKVFKDKSTATYLDDAFKEENPVFMAIPLNHEVFRKTPVKYRNILVHSSMCFVFNSYTIQEVKWYETGLLKTLLTIIAVVLAPWTGGGSLTLLAVLQVVTYFIISSLILKFVIAPIFKYVAKALGPEAAAILATVLAIAGALTGNPKAAQMMLSLSRYVFQGIDLLLKEKMQDLQEDFAELKSESDKLNKELERAQGLLDTSLVLDPMLMVREYSTVVWGESADAFIVSRLQAPSLNLAIIQTPGIFVELMLRLPSANETLNIR